MHYTGQLIWYRWTCSVPIKTILHKRFSFAGVKDFIPQRKNDSYEGFEDLINRCNLWMKERTDILVINMQSVIVQQNEGRLPYKP